MSVFKLAVYGAIGYMVYKTFFAEQASLGGTRRSHGHDGRHQHGGPVNPSATGQGRVEQTEDASGTSVRHRVGRGVI